MKITKFVLVVSPSNGIQEIWDLGLLRTKVPNGFYLFGIWDWMILWAASIMLLLLFV